LINRPEEKKNVRRGKTRNVERRYDKKRNEMGPGRAGGKEKSTLFYYPGVPKERCLFESGRGGMRGEFSVHSAIEEKGKATSSLPGRKKKGRRKCSH